MRRTKRVFLDLKPNEMVDITREVEDFVRESEQQEGSVLIFVVGSTGAVTTIEYEPGLRKDLSRLMEELIPYNPSLYEHTKRWGDDNASSHLRASLIGPSLVVPFSEGKLALGTWQQVVVINFDTKPRRREVVLQLL